MKIEYLGHSCFRLDDELVIDPYKDGSVPGLPELRSPATKVICSHEHADHSGRECVVILRFVKCRVGMMIREELFVARIRFL